MSKLDDLISKLCPDGVEYKTLGEVTEIGKGIQFNKENMADFGTYPVINGGINPSGFIEQYNNEENAITISQGGASAGYVNFITSKFWAGAHCYVVKPTKYVLNRYIYHFIKSNEYKLQECQYGAGIPALSKATVSELQIPVPPLEVQNEIVRILDKFTSLEAELEAELEARRRQYEYYRDSLLTFGDDVEWKRMDEVFDIQMCKRILKQHTTPDGEIPFYQNGTIGKQAKLFITRELYEEMKAKYKLPKKGEILLSTAGTVGRAVVYNGEEAFFQDSNVVWLSNDESLINNEFLFHYCKSMPWKIPSRGTIKHLHNYMIAETLIPILSKERQSQISQILDRFESLCNDITFGLPAELEARHKQYEYYRDKLLTFKRKEG